MKLTREEALRLHKEMWTNMLAELGETGSGKELTIIRARNEFKRKWCESHFPGTIFLEDCILCEFAKQERMKHGYQEHRCHYCPINWGHNDRFGCESNDVIWNYSPISEILALPERKVE